MNLPVKYYEGNLYITDSDSCYAVYKLKGNVYNFISESQKEALREKDNAFLQAMDTKHLKILGKPYFSSIRDRHELIKKSYKGPLADVARAHTDGITDYLIRMRGDEGNETERFVLIKLRKLKNYRRYLMGEELITHLGYEYYE